MTRQRALWAPPRKPRTRRARHLLVEVGRRTAWLTADGAGLVAVLDYVDTPRQWDYRRRLWMVPVARADDVLARVEHGLGWAVTVEAVDR
ncbi:MAG: hypothetical protein H0T66_14395 [Geodermatophilaceae bacterium]|nr:hypothetical protein [Geodermatophilaceae bacterium]